MVFFNVEVIIKPLQLDWLVEIIGEAESFQLIVIVVVILKIEWKSEVLLAMRKNIYHGVVTVLAIFGLPVVFTIEVQRK